MMNSHSALGSLSNSDLLARTREIVEDSCRTEADLLLHLGEIDERKLYLERSFASMFAFGLGELRFSEGATYNRILVARAARQIPAIIDAMRFGKVHLAGLRLLAPHLTAENHREVLAQAAGKSKREIEELVARLSPQPPVAPSVRKLPARPQAPAPLALALSPAARPVSKHEDHRPTAAHSSNERARGLVPGLIIGHFAHASRRVPGARERALRARGQITLGSPLLFRGDRAQRRR